MPIGEIIKAVTEVAKETSKEAKKILKELDKPLHFSELSEVSALENNEFEGWLNELDKPLDSENAFKDNSARAGKIESIQDNKTDDITNDDIIDTSNCEQIESEKTDELKDDEINNSEIEEKQGGRFGNIFKEGEGDTVEVHHMPADSVTELSRNDGPAIKMDKMDHRETASWGNSREAREYRNRQKELIDEGKFDEALQMDMDDIHEKFGDKYDNAINEMLEYIDELKEEGRM